MSHAPDIPRERFTAMMRLDHNRADGASSRRRAGVGVAEVTNMTVWGNHSATQYPDIFHAKVGGRPAAEVVADQAVARGASSSRPCRSAARRSSRRAAPRARRRRRTRRSITSATGCGAPPRATGSRWRCPRTAPTACPRGCICGVPVRTAGGALLDRRGARDRRVRARAHRRERRRAGRGARRGARAGAASLAAGGGGRSGWRRRGARRRARARRPPVARALVRPWRASRGRA